MHWMNEDWGVKFRDLMSEIRGLRSDCGYGRYVEVLLLVLIILSECHFLVKYISIRFLYGA